MTPMTLHGRLLGISLVLLAGCAKGQSTNSAAGDATDRPAGATAAAPNRYTLAVGTRIDAALTNTISSRNAKAGDAFTASVVEDVKNAGGAVATPPVGSDGTSRPSITASISAIRLASSAGEANVSAAGVSTSTV